MWAFHFTQRPRAGVIGFEVMGIAVVPPVFFPEYGIAVTQFFPTEGIGDWIRSAKIAQAGTAEDPGYAQKTAFDHPMAAYGFDHIPRTGWSVDAGRGKQGGDRHPVHMGR